MSCSRRQPDVRSLLRLVRLVPGCVALVACESRDLPQEWHEQTDHRWRELRVEGGDPGFAHLAPSRSGIDFLNRLDEELALDNDHLLIGSGVALGDVDGDGLLDIYLNGLQGPSRLFRNLGRWSFEDITERAGVAGPDRFSTGATFGDVDGDGDLDLITTALGGPNALYLNDGTGMFDEATAEAGLTSNLGSTTIALADIDGDGDLDLYVANYKTESAADVLRALERPGFQLTIRAGDSTVVAPEYREHFRIEMIDGRRVAAEQAEPDWLYVNDGKGRFERVPWTDGHFLDADGQPLARPIDDFALAARFFDVDGDSDPDLYVCNDFDDPDHFWINDGAGRFRAAPTVALRTTSHASMAMDFADIERDGDVDLFVSDMLSRDRERRMSQRPLHGVFPKVAGRIDDRPQFQRNTLFRNRGDATFSQIAEYAGVDASEWSWGTLFLDVDLDGFEDLLIANGHGRDMQNADAIERISDTRGTISWRDTKLLYPDLFTRNVAFRNRGDLTFEEVGRAWGFAVEEDISHGMAAGDLDGDGDADLVINRLGASATVLRNQSDRARVAVRLRGAGGNTQGIGAKVRYVAAGLPPQEREITAGGLYLSGSEPSVTFAAGPPQSARSDDGGTLEVQWRSGRRSRIEDVRANRLYEIREPGGTIGGHGSSEPVRSQAPGVAPFFVDVSDRLGHVHVESEFNDFARQPLMTEFQSRSGPGVTWADMDGDGDADLMVGSGAGGALTLMRNEGGEFVRERLGSPSRLDQTTVLPIAVGTGAVGILLGQSAYETRSIDELRSTPSALRVDLGAGTATAALPPSLSAIGPMAQADVDGDGDLDVFAGGRTVPGLFPVHASSRLFRNVGGSYELDPASDSFGELGLVSAATFSDLEGDGDPDLVLALDWGGIRVWLNEDASFRDVTAALGLDGHTSRWNGLAAGDLDGDGLPDLVATSWGKNTRYRAVEASPAYVFHGDFDHDGTWDLVEARVDARGAFLPTGRFERIRAALPSLRSTIPDFATYSVATVEDVLGAAYDEAFRLEASGFEHKVFMNHADRFDSAPLPIEAQLAPAFHVGIADFDGDGREDVFLSQNYFATEPYTPRFDAGRGLWLRGDGRGGLEPVPGQESGIAAWGDQRGAAFADFDGDGRLDLAIGQNASETKLYRNVGARPGLRVRLVGPLENPWGIGATVRVVYGERMGPAREISSGEGYWSADHAVAVLGLEATPTAVWVRWPGGAETTTPLVGTTRDVAIRWPGGS